ncbi:MAG TPA: DUF4350 domain-containing protein [Candidatus Eisenbacteria bacterium]|jgi:hypothetical protein
MRRPILASMLALALFAARAHAQQMPDTAFDTRVRKPAFAKRHPRVVIDEAHHNFHTLGGRYAPFAALIAHDGCHVAPSRDRFTARSLAAFDILVISNALGHEDMGDSAASHSAFTPEECDAVKGWVERGGALLLIADHAPMGAAARELGRTLGVDMRNGYAIDTLQAAAGNPSTIAYDAQHGLAVGHPILRGRDSTERVGRVVAFTGQSLSGPPGSTALLRLSDKAEDLMVGLGEASLDVPAEKRRSAAGRAQGLAFTLGMGRVVVLAEAAMMTAQVAGPERHPMGMNVPGSDDRQFALNVVRWLGRAL